MGQGEWKSKINKKSTKEYKIWLHMISRCYSNKHQNNNKSYLNVTVCERWKCFQNFCEDLKNIIGYDDWISNVGYELDKDILCEKLIIKPKIYSLETCMFVSKKVNVSESTTRKNLTGYTYVGTNSMGESFEFKNMKDFADKNGLSGGDINMCIKGIRKQHKGWTFKIKF